MTLEETDRLTLTIDEVARLLGIGRNMAYARARSGNDFPVKRLGTRLIVPRAGFYRWLNGGDESDGTLS